jgi:hypothetical protein
VPAGTRRRARVFGRGRCVQTPFAIVREPYSRTVDPAPPRPTARFDWPQRMVIVARFLYWGVSNPQTIFGRTSTMKNGRWFIAVTLAFAGLSGVAPPLAAVAGPFEEEPPPPEEQQPLEEGQMPPPGNADQPPPPVVAVEEATIYPTMPPPDPIPELRPPAPAWGYVWIDGYWDWTGLDWTWNGGYWIPQRTGRTGRGRGDGASTVTARGAHRRPRGARDRRRLLPRGAPSTTPPGALAPARRGIADPSAPNRPARR